MKDFPSIVIIARPGRDQRSLAALLKTLGRMDLFLYDGETPGPASPPDLVLVDLGALDRAAAASLTGAARSWPSARRLALVDDIRCAGQAQALGADCTLTRSAPAGELLQAVRRLSAPSLV